VIEHHDREAHPETRLKQGDQAKLKMLEEQQL
jgi:hypothetical protein